MKLGGQYRTRLLHPQQPYCCGHLMSSSSTVVFESLHVAIWAAEADTQRLEILLESRKHPVAGSETSNQENRLYDDVIISLRQKNHNAHIDRSRSLTSLLLKGLDDGRDGWFKK